MTSSGTRAKRASPSQRSRIRPLRTVALSGSARLTSTAAAATPTTGPMTHTPGRVLEESGDRAGDDAEGAAEEADDDVAGQQELAGAHHLDDAGGPDDPQPGPAERHHRGGTRATTTIATLSESPSTRSCARSMPALDAVGVDRRGFGEDLRLALHGRDHGPRRAEGEPGDEAAEDDRDDDDDRDDLVGVEGRGEEDAPVAAAAEAEHDPGQEGPGVVTEQGHAQAADHGEGDAGDDQRELSHVAGHRAESGDDRIHGGADQHDDRGRDVDPDPGEDCSGEQQEEARGPGDHRDDEPALALEEQRHGAETPAAAPTVRGRWRVSSAPSSPLRGPRPSRRPPRRRRRRPSSPRPPLR